MIVAILGYIDLITGILFWIFGIWGVIPESVIIFLGSFVLIKGIIFVFGKDFASALDIIAAIIIFLSFQISISALVVIAVSLYLIQKGAISLLMSNP